MKLNKEQEDKIKELLSITIGQASMLWSIRPIGIFYSTEGKELMEDTYNKLLKLLEDK